MRHILLIVSALLTPAFCPGRAHAAEPDARLQNYYCEETKKPFFAEAAGEKGRFTPQRTDAQPDSFLMPKPAGTKRVFIIGESVAALLGPGKELSGKRTAGKKLLDKLFGNGAAEDNSGIEIINCGMGGYESYRIYEVLKEILGYSPDLIVALSGNNDTKEESCPGFQCELRRRKFRLLERFFSMTDTAREARKKASLKMQEAMLFKMAASSRKAGVPIVFCTLPAAVKDMPPRQPAPLENRTFALGYRLFYAKKHAAALEQFKAALAADPREPFFNFYAAKSLEQLGRNKEAAVYYSNALNYDTAMSRAGRERNDLIRRAAAAEGACAADLENFFLRVSSGGLPGFREFTDGMHWNISYNKPVWEEIFRAAGRCGIKGFDKFTSGGRGLWPETSRETALKRLGYAFSWLEGDDLNEASLAELVRIKKEQPELLKIAGASPEQLKGLLLNNFWSAEKISHLEKFFPFFLAHLAETERRTGDYPRALALCRKALALKPGDPLLKFERAQVVGDMGGQAEDGFFALAEEPSLKNKAAAVAAAYGVIYAAEPVPHSGAAAAKAAPVSKENARLSKDLSDQAVEKIFANDLKAAEELSLNALKKNPFNAGALMSLCSLRQKDGRIPQALEACREAVQAVYQDPANRIPSLEMLACDAAFECYKMLKVLGREPEAVNILNLCVKRAPASWPGLAAAKSALKAR